MHENLRYELEHLPTFDLIPEIQEIQLKLCKLVRERTCLSKSSEKVTVGSEMNCSKINLGSLNVLCSPIYSLLKMFALFSPSDHN